VPRLSIEELRKRYEAGQTLEEIARARFTEPELNLLKRCAAPRSFDRALFEALLCADTAPGLEELVTSGDLERSPAATDRYRMRQPTRQTHLDAWWTDEGLRPGVEPVPDGFRKFSQRLSDYYAETNMQLEQLYHLLVAAPSEAERLFDELFVAADRRFDLAGCQDVLDVVQASERLGLMTAGLTKRVNQCHAYLRARSRWAMDYYATTAFLDRQVLREALHELVGGGPHRILELYARGGLGKTIELRWFTARYCLPQYIPFARIDFDISHPVNATRRPWLVLLHFAEQLNSQVATAAFADILKRYGHMHALLDRQPTQAAFVAGTLETVTQPADLYPQFHSAVRESIGDRPVVFMLDTLEEILLGDTAGVHNLLSRLAELMDMQNVRFVLSGRYRLADKLNGPIPLAPDRSISVEPFTPTESMTYLKAVRGIKRTDAVGAIVARTNGMPFTLALYADVMRQEPDVPVEDLFGRDAEHDPEVVYLVRRVLSRIADPAVRWVLRYGVLPRRMSRQYLSEVMASFLADSMSGASREYDDPDDDHLPPSDEVRMFYTDLLTSPRELTEHHIAKLWTTLAQYAAGYGWVSTAESETLVFHEQVREPMRRVLRGRPRYAQLHEASIAYFERRALQDQAEWVRWKRESLYHRFQLLGQAAVPYWRDALNDAFKRGGWALRGEIAAELWRSDEYVDEDDAPRAWRDTEPIVTRAVLAQAAYERARCGVEVGRARRLPPGDTLWSDAELAFQAAQRLDPKGPSVLPASGMAVLEATLRFSRGDKTTAYELLEGAIATSTGREEALQTEEAFADLLRGWDDQAAQAHYTRALELAQYPDERVPLLRAYVEVTAAQDQLATAMIACHQGRDLAAPEARRGFQLSEIELRLRNGQPARALELAQRIDAAPEFDQQGPLAWSAIAELRLGEPLTALAHLETLVNVAARPVIQGLPSTSPIGPPDLDLGLRLTRARLLAELNDADSAARQFEDVTAEARRRGLVAAAATSELAHVALHVHVAGNLTAARQRLQSVEQEVMQLGGDLEAEWLFLDAQLATRTDDAASAAGRLRTATLSWWDRRHGRPPRQRVRAAIAGLVCGDGPDRGFYAQMLADALERATPRSARVAMLQDLAFCKPLSGVDVKLLQRIRDSVDDADPRARDQHPRDAALQSTWLAELDRVCGDGVSAALRLDEAVKIMVQVSEPPIVVWRDWLKARYRVAEAGAPVELAEWINLHSVAELTGAHTTAGCSLALELARFGAHDAEFALPLLQRVISERAAGPGQTADAYRLRFELTLASGRSAAVDDLRQAAALYDRSGDRQSLRHVETMIQHQAAHSLTFDHPRTVVVAVSNQWVRWTVSDGDREQTLRLVPPPALSELIQSGNQQELLARLVYDWQGIAAELAPLAALPPPMPGNLAQGLVVEDARLAAVPWEIATHGSQVTLYRSLAGGGPIYAQAHTLATMLRRLNFPVLSDPPDWEELATQLAAFKASAGLPPGSGVDRWTWSALQVSLRSRPRSRLPQVLLLRASNQAERRYLQGQSTLGYDLTSLWKSYGFEVFEQQDPLPDMLDSLSIPPPAIVHIAASVASDGTALTLDFSAVDVMDYESVTTSNLPGIGVSVLDRLMQRWPADVRPIVIVDLPRPSTPTEAARKWLWRNQFCQQLFELGNTPYLLAMGFVDAGQSFIYQQLLSHLGTGGSIADVPRMIADLLPAPVPGEALQDVVVKRGMALFSACPPIAIPETWD
jgi:hypothetical protein